MRWPPRSTGRPLRDGGGASAGRPARVTGEGRGTLPQTRRENMPPDSAAKQCRQEVTVQNLPSLGSFRCATCRIERRIGGVNGGDASRGQIEGSLRRARGENTPPDSADKQGRQEVTRQNVPSLGRFRGDTCRSERRIGGVNGGDASRGRIEGRLRGDASRGRFEGTHRGGASRG